jgi:hypothetical protein
MFRIAAAAALLLSSTAFADRATHRLDALAAHVASRASAPGLSRRQARTLATVSRALVKDTYHEWSDVAAAATSARSIGSAFPGDVEFDGDLDAATAAFIDDLAADRRALEDLLPSIVDEKMRSAARRRLDRIPVEDAGRGPRTRAAKFRRVAKRAAALEKAYETAGVGAAFIVGVVNGVPFASDYVDRWMDAGRAFAGGIDFEGFDRRTHIASGHWSSIGLAIDGLGTAGAPTLALGTFYQGLENPYGDRVTWAIDAPAAAGTLTVTRFDADARVVEGTFAFTATVTPDSYQHPPPVEISGGRFRITRLP